ncbi:MAG: DUF4258 domain-containing protein [Polyangiales bacterium]
MPKPSKRNLSALVVAAIVALLTYLQQNLPADRSPSTGSPNSQNSPTRPATDDSKTPNSDQKRPSIDFSLTRHAQCRMSCRQIRKAEIEEVIAGGRINENKSDPNATPCPAVAYEGRTSDGQLARIVVGDCPARKKIITVIDLEHDYPCDCD